MRPIIIKDYTRFVQVLYPILVDRYKDDTVQPEQLRELFKELFGFTVEVKPDMKDWTVYFDDKSYTYFMLAYS